MLFPVPAPFRRSVYENVVFGLRLHGWGDGREMTERATEALTRAMLFEEVRDQLDLPARRLGPGQQQRLCLARALALRPAVMLFDEPLAKIDPLEATQVEAAIGNLGEVTVVVATRHAGRAGRVAHHMAYMEHGTVLESGPTEDLFTHPKRPETEAYLSRRAG